MVKELWASVANKAPLPDGALEGRPVVLPSSHLKWSEGLEKATASAGWLDVKSNKCLGSKPAHNSEGYSPSAEQKVSMTGTKFS